jgi:serine/threonine protein kinase/tetratricopeptide (TPR) repeat protein
MSAESARPAPDPPVATDGNEPSLAKGATIGRYVVLGLIGRGGMGEVYAAYDPELDRKIAIKLLRARGRDAAALADGKTRLLREAQAIARLSHPNVVVVFDVGTFGDSIFIAMEFVEGNTLGYWLEAEPRNRREVLDVFMSAGRGLIAAHAAGLVHRDFKPDNVMLTRSGQVRVMDFGLARYQTEDNEPSPAGKELIDAEARAAAVVATLPPDADPDATAKLGAGAAAPPPSASGGYLRLKLTQTGAMLGTPAYMAPEQFAGLGGDARTDQFSFAVALYEGLYGQRPFEGNNVMAIMANVVSGTVREPPEKSRVPSWIRKIVLRALATKPDDRFPAMTDLLGELAKDPVARRRRWLGTAASLVLVAGLAAGAVKIAAGQRALCAGGKDRAAAAWGPKQREAVERAFKATGNTQAAAVFTAVATTIDQYIARWTGMYAETCEATHVRGEQSNEVLDLRMGCLGERLSSVKALTDVFVTADSAVIDTAGVAASALPAIDRCGDVAMLRAVLRPPDDPIKRAQGERLRDEIAKIRALATVGQCEQASKMGRGVLERAVALDYAPVKAEASLAVGRLGETCLPVQQAVEHLEEAVLAAETSRHDEVSIVASVMIAGIGVAKGGLDSRTGWTWIKHGEAILKRFPGHPLLEAWTSVSRADVLARENRYEESLAANRRALAMEEPVLGPNSHDVAIANMNIAVDLHELGREAEAEPFIHQAVEAEEKAVGPQNGWVAAALLDECEILTGLGKFEAAEKAIQRAIAIWTSSGTGPWFRGYGFLDLGRLYLAAGRPRDAREALERSSELLAKDQDQQLAAEAEFALAQALWAVPRDRPRALPLARHARAKFESQGGSTKKREAMDAWLRLHLPS